MAGKHVFELKHNKPHISPPLAYVTRRTLIGLARSSNFVGVLLENLDSERFT